jgi:hypothetical protein
VAARSCSFACAALVALASPAAAEPRQPELAYESEAWLEVDGAERAIRRITELAGKLGGRPVQATESEITVDVPRGRFAELERELDRIGERAAPARLWTVDLSEPIEALEAEARSARASRERLERARASSGDMATRLALEREIQDATNRLASAQSRIAAQRARGAATRVRIRFRARPEERLPVPELPFAWLGEVGLPSLLGHGESEQEPAMELRANLEGSASVGLLRFREPERLDGTAYAGAARLNLRGLGEADPVGIFGGLDLGLGASSGFVYSAGFVLGPGMTIGDHAIVGVGAGAGVDGITSVVPFGVGVPIELYLWLDPTPWLDIALWVQNGWVLASEARAGGARSAPFGDELALGVSLAFGERDDWTWSEDRTGPWIGFVYRELLGTASYELRLGIGARITSFSEKY